MIHHWSRLPADIGLPSSGQHGDEHQATVTRPWNQKLRMDAQHHQQRIRAWVLKGDLYPMQARLIGQQVSLHRTHQLNQSIRELEYQVVEVRQPEVRHMGQTTLADIQHSFQIALNRGGISILIQMSAVGPPGLAFTDAVQQSLYTAHEYSCFMLFLGLLRAVYGRAS